MTHAERMLLVAARELGEAMREASEALTSQHYLALQDAALAKVDADGTLTARQMADLAAILRMEVEHYAAD